MSMKLTLAQLHLSQGSIYKACDVLRSLGDLSQKPGVVSSIYVHVLPVAQILPSNLIFLDQTTLKVLKKGLS